MNKPSEHHNGEKRMGRGERKEGLSSSKNQRKIEEGEGCRCSSSLPPLTRKYQEKGRRKRMIEDVVKNASRTIHPFVLTLQGHSSPLLLLLSLSRSSYCS